VVDSPCNVSFVRVVYQIRDAMLGWQKESIMIPALGDKEKELAAVGISVAAGCRPCTDYHLSAVRKVGATEEEIRQAVIDAVAVRKDATEMMAEHAFAALRANARNTDAGEAAAPNRVKALVSVGAALAVNCTSSLEQHLVAARSVGLSPNEIRAVLKLAGLIKRVAASHVEKQVGIGSDRTTEPAKNASTGRCS
jgi:AhpD family alkylhydroperoxidase